MAAEQTLTAIEQQAMEDLQDHFEIVGGWFAARQIYPGLDGRRGRQAIFRLASREMVKRRYHPFRGEVFAPVVDDFHERTCRECACTQNHACFDEERGACHWVEEDLCSHCQPKAGGAA